MRPDEIPPEIIKEIPTGPLRLKVIEALMPERIPAHHITGLQRITFAPVPGVAWETPLGSPLSLRGSYLSDLDGDPIRSIHLSPHYPDEIGHTLVHELGHHLCHTGYRRQDPETDAALNILFEFWSLMCLQFYHSGNPGLDGLRVGSYSDSQEFYADLYCIYVANRTATKKVDLAIRAICASRGYGDWNIERIFRLARR